MDSMSLLTIIGVLVSMGGAGISIWQANLSKRAAEEAKKARAQLIDHRKVSELAQLQVVCKKAQKSMEKYGPASVPASLHGISPEKDAQDVQEFMLLVKENRAYFGGGISNEVDQFCDKLNPILDLFAKSNGSEELREHGKQILLHINNMTSIIKKNLDTKREKAH